MTVPTAGFLGISEQEVLALLRPERVQEEWTLSPVALAKKAERQRRDRKGRFADEGLQPGVGRRAPGWMDRDLAELTDFVHSQREAYPTTLSVDGYKEVGAKVDKIAKRYSKSQQMRKRAKEAEIRANELFEIGFQRWSADWAHGRQGDESKLEVQDYLEPAERLEYDMNSALQLDLTRSLDKADAEAHLGILRKLRPMGGQPKIGKVTTNAEQFSHDELADLDERFADALIEVGRVLPTDWVEELNGKGQVDVIFSTDRAWCSTSEESGSEPDPWEHAREEFSRLGREGHEFLGTHRGYSAFLMFRRPDGDIVALRSDGRMVTGVGAYEDTPLVMDAKGDMQLPEFAVRPQGDWREFIEPMANIKPPRQSNVGSALGPEHDHYKQVREAVARYEAEGWTYIGNRGPWATLRKGEEEISLNWAGKPFEKVHMGGSPTDDPLDPYGQIPLPPLPVKINSEIKIDPKDRSTLLHEYGHRIEAALGEKRKSTGSRPLMGALLQFLSERRTEGRTKPPEPLRKLSEITGNLAYEDHEVAFEDKFHSPYIGKEYRGYATEVLTMGLQAIFYPTHRDNFDNDPDMRDFILGLLAAA